MPFKPSFNNSQKIALAALLIGGCLLVGSMGSNSRPLPANQTPLATAAPVVVSANDYTIDELYQAISSNDQALVQQILDSGSVDLNEKNSEQLYPLEATLVFSNVEMADLLLSSGADPNVVTSSGKTIAELVSDQGTEAMKNCFKTYSKP